MASSIVSSSPGLAWTSGFQTDTRSILVQGDHKFGAWRSLASHLPWEQGIAGSNPAAPISCRRGAQSGSALAWGARGRRFKSAHADCDFPVSLGVWLSLVEHLVRVQGVGGSNPPIPTEGSLHFTAARDRSSTAEPSVDNRQTAVQLRAIPTWRAWCSGAAWLAVNQRVPVRLRPLTLPSPRDAAGVADRLSTG